MNILYVVNDFFPLFHGGVERYVLNICKQMQRMGNGVKVLTYGMDSKESGYSRKSDILFKEYYYENVHVIAARHLDIPADIGFRIGDEIFGKNISGILPLEEIDVIHIAHPMKCSAITSAAARFGIPTVLTLTDFWLLCPMGRLYKPDYSPCNTPMEGEKCIRECGIDNSVTERYKLAKDMFERVTRVIAPSRLIIDVFEQNGWSKDISLVRHGVDYRYVKYINKEQKNMKSPVVVGYTGLITKFKGVDLLVEIFKSIKSEKLELHIYGDIYKEWVWQRAFYEKLKASVQSDTRIKLKGKYTHNELSEIFTAIDISIVPSTTLESYGLVVVESLSHGVPVVASDIVGSAREYITDGINGFIFSLEKPDTLKGIIEDIARDPTIINALRQHIVLPPRIEEEAFTLESIYRRLIA